MTWFKRLIFYLNPFSKDANAKSNFSLKAMHGINRISIYLFITAIFIMLVRYLTRG